MSDLIDKDNGDTVVTIVAIVIVFGLPMVTQHITVIPAKKQTIQCQKVTMEILIAKHIYI